MGRVSDCLTSSEAAMSNAELYENLVELLAKVTSIVHGDKAV